MEEAMREDWTGRQTRLPVRFWAILGLLESIRTAESAKMLQRWKMRSEETMLSRSFHPHVHTHPSLRLSYLIPADLS